MRLQANPDRVGGPTGPVSALWSFESGEGQFCAWRGSYTRAFERYALELSRHMTIKDAARHLGTSWDVIKDIQKRSLKRRFSRPKLHNLKQIAIDEISIGKGHRYRRLLKNSLHNP